MIFGGYGKKAKQRGEVFWPCVSCENPSSVHGLVENYGYGQLYGVRVLKYGTHRYMVCSLCQSGAELSRPQWDAARQISDGLRTLVITEEVILLSMYALADRAFPDMAGPIRELFAESAPEVAPQPTPAQLHGGQKPCPDCAELVMMAARKCRYCGLRFDDERLSA